MSSTEGAPARWAELRTIAMPADTNAHGDIFGGWLLSQMDLAGSVVAYERAGGRIATVAIEAMTFHKPVFVGDAVCCYAHLRRVGSTSVTFAIEAWVVISCCNSMVWIFSKQGADFGS